MRDADRTKARFVAIIGEAERTKGVAILKNMATSEQQEVVLNNVEGFYQILSGRQPSSESPSESLFSDPAALDKLIVDHIMANNLDK
jgi:hypothetical protein